MSSGFRAAANRLRMSLGRAIPLGLVLIGLAVVAWAILPIALKPAAESVPAPWLVFVRFLGGSLALAPWVARRACRYEHGVWRQCRQLRWLIALMILLGFAVPQILFTWAIGVNEASVVSFLVYAYPCFSVLFAALLLKEPLSARFRVGLGFLALGLFLVSLGQGRAAEAKASAAVIIGAPLLVSVCWGVSTVMTKKLLDAGIPGLLVAYLRIAGGTVVLLPIFLATRGYRHEPWATLDGPAWWGLAFSAFVPVAIALPLYTAGLKTVPVRRASIVEAWTPMLTAVFAMLILRERLTLQQWIGGALIVAATTLATSRRARKRVRAA